MCIIRISAGRAPLAGEPCLCRACAALTSRLVTPRFPQSGGPEAPLLFGPGVSTASVFRAGLSQRVPTCFSLILESAVQLPYEC